MTLFLELDSLEGDLWDNLIWLLPQRYSPEKEGKCFLPEKCADLMMSSRGPVGQIFVGDYSMRRTALGNGRKVSFLSLFVF